MQQVNDSIRKITDIVGESPTIVHIGILVWDLEKTVSFFETFPGLKFTKFYETQFKREWVNGVEIPAGSIRVAKVYIGTVGLEIIAPLSGNPYQKMVLESHGEGFHHIALLFKGSAGEVEEKLRAAGYGPCWTTELQNGRIAHYFGMNHGEGPVVEIMNDWPNTWPNPDAVDFSEL